MLIPRPLWVMLRWLLVHLHHNATFMVAPGLIVKWLRFYGKSKKHLRHYFRAVKRAPPNKILALTLGNLWSWTIYGASVNYIPIEPFRLSSASLY